MHACMYVCMHVCVYLCMYVLHQRRYHPTAIYIYGTGRLTGFRPVIGGQEIWRAPVIEGPDAQ
jgi:hypothetical protein